MGIHPHIFVPQFQSPARPYLPLIPPSPPQEWRCRRRREFLRCARTYRGRVSLPGLEGFAEELCASGMEASRIGNPLSQGGLSGLQGLGTDFFGNANPLSSLTDAAAYWTGSSTTDATGHGNTLTAVNSPTFNTGKVNNAFYCNETVSADSYYTAADSSYLRIGSGVDFSLALWFYMPSDGQAVAIDRGTFTTGDTFRIFRSSTGTGHILTVGWGGTGSAGENFNAGSALSNATWYWICATCHPDGSNGSAFVYLNNTTDSSKTGTAVAFAGSDNLTTYIGERPGGVVQSPGVCRIDEAGIWKRVITSTERGLLYNSGNGATAYP